MSKRPIKHSIHKYNRMGRLVNPWDPGYFSVTTILAVKHNTWLWHWKLKVGKEESDRISFESSGRGTRVHRRIEKMLNGHVFKTIPEEIKPYIEAFNNWMEDTQPKILNTELFVKSDRHGFAGSIDLVCEINDRLWVIDFKTSKAIYDEYGLQIRAYGYAYDEMLSTRAHTAVLQLGLPTKKGWKFRELKEPIGIFLAHKKIFDWEKKKHPIRKPK